MHKLIRKLLGKLNIEIALVFSVFIVFAVLIISGFNGATYVLAGNTATQVASSTQATTISVVGKMADTAIATITFPEGAPTATVSVPYNDVDTASDPQVLSATISEPVVRLKNTSGVTYNVTLEITTWSNSVAVSEDYELVATSATNIETVASVLSSNGNAASVDTGVSMGTSVYKALYLELVLSEIAQKTGNSTLTILGETA